MVIGFDAFLDESIRIVGERTSPEAYAPMASMSSFGQWAMASAGHSGSREFVCEEVLAGGCAVNMGDGVASLGFPLTAFTGVGDPPHPAFQSFTEKCESVYPLGMQPGRALVSEFDDGKLMLCSFSHFAEFTPSYLRQNLADGVFRRACEQAGAIVFTSWSVYPYMTACWQYLCREVLAGITNQPQFLFDLADPASRPVGDLRNMVSALCEFESIGPVTLSLNGNEAKQLALALDMDDLGDHRSAIEKLAIELRHRLQIDTVCIHLLASATMAQGSRAVTIDGPFCERPQRSAGAGDRFNAGLLAGKLLGLDEAGCLYLGTASSGFFVRKSRSANWPELVEFLSAWGSGNIEHESKETNEVTGPKVIDT